MIRTITIEREYGSGGGDVARKLAARLGWKLWDQALTDEIARLMDCPSRTVEEREERKDSVRYRLFKAFMKGSFEGTLNAPKLKMVDADCIKDFTRRLVTDVAREGNAVIVGRGSAYHLHDRPDAFHVFVYAPFEEKVRRLCGGGKSETEAIELAETVDRDRAAYIKQYFDLDWPPREYFHVMINTTMGDERVVETILNSVALLQQQPASV
ncbi:MAG: cytidylate kinase-like family protein [Bryobacteraceae bacterium]|jgi:cytidylate kinase